MNLDNLGDVAMQRGDLVKAEQYYDQASAIQHKQAPASRDAALGLEKLGDVAKERGDLHHAEDYYRRALAIRQQLSSSSLDVAESLNSLAYVAQQRGDPDQAEEYERQALEIREKLAPDGLAVAASLYELGDIAQKRGNQDKAEEYYRKALPIWQRLSPESMEHAQTLAALAAIVRRKGQPEAGARLYDQALNALESQAARLGGGGEVRTQFRAKFIGYYKDYVDLLITQRQPELAFHTLERSRARALLEMLAAAHVDVRKGVDPKLLEHERSLQQMINAKSGRRLRLLSNRHSEQQLIALNKEIDEALAQYIEAEDQIRINSPAYAALTQPRPLTAPEVQQQLLDDNTVLLEYSLGEERSYVFVLTPSSFECHELPKQAVIEALARRFYESLTAPNRRIPGETELRRQARLADASRKFPKVASQLSGVLLGPLAERISGEAKRLLIVSDGALQSIPFAALAAPETAAGSPQPIPLMVTHEIINLPSASVLAVLRQDETARQPAVRTVAVLADPVFDTRDARVKRGTAGQRPVEQVASGTAKAEAGLSSDRLTRSAEDIGLTSKGVLHLPRLLFTRAEAHSIMASIPPGTGLEALDFQASRVTATSPELAQYRIVHFATHGILDNKHPELSGLVLSLVDDHGKTQDGFLELQDIYNLSLPVELVVLSACDTGLGKEINGEGLTGLTRGFMYAGASRVVASLWKVSDVATARLMAELYQAMEHDHMRPAAALRQAQIRMWKQHRWSSPYYWAAFQIQGEWK